VAVKRDGSEQKRKYVCNNKASENKNFNGRGHWLVSSCRQSCAKLEQLEFGPAIDLASGSGPGPRTGYEFNKAAPSGPGPRPEATDLK